MIRKLMASTAVLALMSTGAFTLAQAQTEEPANPPVLEEQAQTTAPATEVEPTTELAESEATLTPDQPTLASVFIGRSVYSSEDPESDNIGDINDLIVSEDGTITHAVVGVGGFLGIGEKDVAVPFDELEVVEKDGDIRLIYASTREQLEAAPALDRTAFDPTAQYAEEQAASTDTGAGTLAPAPAEPSQDMAAAPAEEPAAPAEEETAAAPAEEPVAPAEEETAAAPAEEPVAPAEEETAAAPAEEPVAPAEHETAAAPAEKPVAPAEEETAAAPAEEPVAPAEEETAAAPVEEPAASAEEETAAAPVEEPAASAEEETAAVAPDEAAPAEPSQDMAAAPAEETAAPAEEETATVAPDEAAPAEPSQDMAAAPDEEPAAPAEEETAAAAPEEAAPAEASQDMAAAPDATAPAAEEEVAADATTPPAEDLTAAPAEEEMAATTEEPAATEAASNEVSFVTASADQLQATDLIGKSVYGSEDESIGEISDLIFEEEGKTRVAVIDVGGFLGAGEKTVGIPFDQLQISKAEDGSEQVKVAMSKADLEQLPAIETAAATDATSPALPAEGEQPADQTATAPAEPAVTTEAPADTAQAPATDEMTTGSISQPIEYAQATQDIAASKLIGAVVYGADDSNLGEVSDLIFAKTGDIEAAVIDVGGFLGLGEKPVALQFGALNIGADENGAVTAKIDATQEQLEQAPTFEEPEQAAVQ